MDDAELSRLEQLASFWNYGIGETIRFCIELESASVPLIKAEILAERLEQERVEGFRASAWLWFHRAEQS